MKAETPLITLKEKFNDRLNKCKSACSEYHLVTSELSRKWIINNLKQNIIEIGELHNELSQHISVSDSATAYGFKISNESKIE